MPKQTIQGLKNELFSHPIYESVRDLESLRIFMQFHVACVWDFMCLLKSVQRVMNPVSSIWVPQKCRTTTRFINEIVLDEESDEVDQGIFMSHFELYLEAMEEIGSSTKPALEFMESLSNLIPFEDALKESKLPPGAQTFCKTTMGFLERPVCHQAAIFYHSRESVIPEMFTRVVQNLKQQGVSCPRFVLYLERHIHMDEEKHGPMSKKLLTSFPNQRHDDLTIEDSVCESLEARLQLWDTIMEELEQDQMILKGAERAKTSGSWQSRRP